MGDIIRRKRDDEIEPVEARRVPPQVIVVPGMMPNQQPPPQAPPPQQAQEGPTHNHYIYVNVPPQGPQQPQQPPQPPQEVHYHKTVHHYTRGGSSPRQQLSMLGLAALALGVVAIVIRFIPGISVATLPVAAIGFALGLLGLLGAVMGGQSNAGVPFAGMFVCLVAAGISLYLTGWLPETVENIQKGQPVQVPPDLIPKIDPSAGAETAPRDGSTGGFNIWDYLPTGGSATKNNAAPGDPAAALAQQIVAAEAAVAKASADLQAVRDAQEQRLQSDPQFSAAKQAADAAHRNLREARSTYEAGSREVAAASQAWMDAVNALGKIRTRLTDAAAVEQAEKKLTDAQAALTKLKQAQTTPPAPAR